MSLIKLLGISGSLRAASLNAMLIRALMRLSPENIHITRYTGMADLPLFNPDLEVTDPVFVAEFRTQLINVDGVIIASPEYAHGISEVMKNALDWMVSNESFVNKPVMLLNASPRATLAQQALRETLLTMSACVIDSACVAVPLLGSGLDETGIVKHAEISATLLNALHLFAQAITNGSASYKKW